MLGRNTNDSECLRQSVEAFREVLQLYEMQGAVKMAAVEEKNLAKAAALLDSQRRRRVARPDWAPPDHREGELHENAVADERPDVTDLKPEAPPPPCP